MSKDCETTGSDAVIVWQSYGVATLSEDAESKQRYWSGCNLAGNEKTLDQFFLAGGEIVEGRSMMYRFLAVCLSQWLAKILVDATIQ